MGEGKKLGTNEDVVRIAAETAAKTAIEVWQRENKQQQQKNTDRRLRNTKLLLRHYRVLKIQSKDAVYDAASLDENAHEVLELMMEGNNAEMVIGSIQRSAIRTAIIVEHIDKMISLYAVWCERTKRENDFRNFRLVYDYYISPEPYTVAELAEREHIAERTVYKNIDSALDTLTILLFGIDATNL